MNVTRLHMDRFGLRTLGIMALAAVIGSPQPALAQDDAIARVLKSSGQVLLKRQAENDFTTALQELQSLVISRRLTRAAMQERHAPLLDALLSQAPSVE